MNNKVPTESISQSVMYHALGMTLILFIAVPYLTFLSITMSSATESRNQMYQTICALLMMGVGTLTSSTFSNHRSVHSVTGLVVTWIVLPIWILSQYTNALKSSIFTAEGLRAMNKWILMALLLFVLPTEWMFGVYYYPGSVWMDHIITSNHLLGAYGWGLFIGHYTPSYALTVSGVYFIWRHQEMECIMNWEMYGLMVPAVSSVGEIINNSKGHQAHFLHHVMLYGTAVILGFVSFLVYKLKIPRRNLWHGICVSLFSGILGKMMLMHQTAGDLRETMHKSFGYVAITAAIARIVCMFWDKLVVIVGMLAVSGGVLLNFSSFVLTYYWEHGNHPFVTTLGRSHIVYFLMAMAIAMWICTVTVTMRYLVSLAKDVPDTKSYELVSLTENEENEGTESVTIHLDESKV